MKPARDLRPSPVEDDYRLALETRDFGVPWVADFLPRVLPAAYRVVQVGADGAKWIRRDGLSVIVSGNVEDDGKRWLHVSTANPRRLPTWEEFREVKDLFVGADRYAVQVFPPRAQYVNIHSYCLHLFACVDGHPLPEFTRGAWTL